MSSSSLTAIVPLCAGAVSIDHNKNIRAQVAISMGARTTAPELCIPFPRRFRLRSSSYGGSLELAFNLGEVGDLMRGGHDLRQELQAVLAEGFVVGVDGDLVEETVDR